MTFRTLTVFFLSNETKKINKGRWKGALLAEVGHVSVLSLLVNWWWAVSMLDSCAQSPRRRDGMHTNTHMQTCCTQGRLDAGPLPLNICWHFCALSDLWWQANHRVLLWRQPSLTLSVSHTCMHRHNQSVALHESCRRQSRGDRSLWAKWKKAAAQLLWKGIQHWVHFSCAVRCVKISAEGLHCWVILFYSYFSNRNVILLLLMDELPSKPASLDNNGTFDSCGVCAV